MKKPTTANTNDRDTRVDDARALAAVTSDAVREKVVNARNRLPAAIENGQETWSNVQEKAVERGETSDQAIRDHSYQAIGVEVGIGAILGFLKSRRNGTEPCMDTTTNAKVGPT